MTKGPPVFTPQADALRALRDDRDPLHGWPPRRDGLLRTALRRLVIAARTSGGTAGRDETLCAACAAAESALAAWEAQK
jgi:hypothetical protein